MEGLAKKNIIRQLQEEILALEGFSRSKADREHLDFGLGPMDAAFPCGSFPTGAVHEFISPTAACAAASNAFIAIILSTLMKREGPCMWISTGRSLFPPVLKHFGIEPHRVIFIDLKRDREALWVMEQALQCNAMAAVVAELEAVSFAESRRLQLAVAESRVTGLLHRRRPRKENTLACVSRWKIRPLASRTPGELPGVGHPAWEVHLEKIRNGTPGKWQFMWQDDTLVHLPAAPYSLPGSPKIERYA